MEIRYYLDPETGLPHIYDHGVTEADIEDVMRGSGENLPAKDQSRMKLGKTRAGRLLKVIFVPDEEPDSIFVITAFELQGKAKAAYRRRRRGRNT